MCGYARCDCTMYAGLQGKSPLHGAVPSGKWRVSLPIAIVSIG